MNSGTASGRDWLNHRLWAPAFSGRRGRRRHSAALRLSAPSRVTDSGSDRDSGTVSHCGTQAQAAGTDSSGSEPASEPGSPWPRPAALASPGLPAADSVRRHRHVPGSDSESVCLGLGLRRRGGPTGSDVPTRDSEVSESPARRAGMNLPSPSPWHRDAAGGGGVSPAAGRMLAARRRPVRPRARAPPPPAPEARARPGRPAQPQWVPR